MLGLKEEVVDLCRYVRQSVAEGRIGLRYQPIYDLGGAGVIGYEVLTRFEAEPNTERTFEVIEEEDPMLAITLGAWVLARSLIQLAPTKAQIWLNVSAHQLVPHKGFDALVREACSRAEVEPSKLVIEITERRVIGEIHLHTIAKLCDMGVGIAIDDFGNRHNNWEMLELVAPVATYLKISKDYLKGGPGSINWESLESLVSVTAPHMGLQTVAEGVEHPAQAQFLQDLGCHYGQGYFFSSELEIAEVPI